MYVLRSPNCNWPPAWSANYWFREMKPPLHENYFYVLDYSERSLKQIGYHRTTESSIDIVVGNVCDVMFINPDSTKILYVYQNYVENVFKCVDETLHNGGAGIIHRETQRATTYTEQECRAAIADVKTYLYYPKFDASSARVSLAEQACPMRMSTYLVSYFDFIDNTNHCLNDQSSDGSISGTTFTANLCDFTYFRYHCFGSISNSDVGGAGNGVILADRGTIELPYTKIYLMRYDQTMDDLYITRYDLASLTSPTSVDFSRTYEALSTSGASANYTTFQLKDTAITSGMDFTTVLIAVVVAVVLVIVFCIVLCCFLKKRWQRQPRVKEMPETGSMEQVNEYTRMKVPAPPIRKVRPVSTIQPGPIQQRETNLETAMRQALFNMAEGLKLDSHRLTIGEALGNGHFGVVYKAELKSKDGIRSDTVAVKTVLVGTDVSDMTQFLEEALRMRSFSHEHVLTMMGIVDLDGHPYVVLPYMANGDLKSYLSDDKREFTISDLLWMALQVAEGMVYLADSHFVHRDLAARNCMVSDEGIVKVADFGLSCDLFDDEYHRTDGENKPLPTKWMAPECFSEKVFSKKSDVWSYGVLLWEIFTRGMVPYTGKSHSEVILYVVGGGRLECPKMCPSEIYDVMKKCWRQEAVERPTFVEIRLMINLLIGGISKKKNVLTNEPDYI